MPNIIVNYDKNNDILYLSIGAPEPSIGEEKEEGIIIRKSIKNKKLSGVTIMDYKYRKQHNMEINVPKEINLNSINV